MDSRAASGTRRSGLVSSVVRDRSLAAARVWQAPAIDPGPRHLGHNPPDFPDGQDVACRFVLRHAGGRTPKFYCALATGEIVKVKYGAGNGELHGEVIAARLLAALGFSADQMLVVRRVRCIGCPAAPFTTLRCLQQVGWTGVCAPGGFGSERIRMFAPAVIERRLPGRAIEASENQGWAWFELDRIDPAAGGRRRRTSMRYGCSRSSLATGTTNRKTSVSSAHPARISPGVRVPRRSR